MVLGQRIGAGDEHMIGPRHRVAGKMISDYGAKPALGPIADYSAAKLLSGRDAIAGRGQIVPAWPNKQHKRWHGHAGAGISF
jgi:hypothetical protein